MIAGQFFEMIGFVPGRRHALMAGLAETGGGLLMALGLLTPFAAAVVFGVMLVAAFSVHIRKGFFITSGGYEYTLVLGVAALTLAFTGPGSLSVDALLRYSDSGAFWGMAAFVVGVLGGIVAIFNEKLHRLRKQARVSKRALCPARICEGPRAGK